MKHIKGAARPYRPAMTRLQAMRTILRYHGVAGLTLVLRRVHRARVKRR